MRAGDLICHIPSTMQAESSIEVAMFQGVTTKVYQYLL